MPGFVGEQTTKMGHAGRYLLEMACVGCGFGYEILRHRISVGTFAWDKAFQEKALTRAREHESQAGLSGFAGLLAVFALSTVAFVALYRKKSSVEASLAASPLHKVPQPRQEGFLKQAFTDFQEGQITAAACKAKCAELGTPLDTREGFEKATLHLKGLAWEKVIELVNLDAKNHKSVFQNLDVFALSWMQELVQVEGGADKVKALLSAHDKNRGTLWNSKRTTVSFCQLLLKMLDKEGGLERVMPFLNFYELSLAQNWVLEEQFDAVIPVLQKMARMDKGKAAVKQVLNQDVHSKLKLLSYKGVYAKTPLFPKIKALVDSLGPKEGEPFFSAADLKDLLITKHTRPDPSCCGNILDAPIEDSVIFEAVMPWLEVIRADPKEGRQMILELLSITDALHGQTPLHSARVIPLAIQLLKPFDPPLTDEEMRPLLVARREVSYFQETETTVPLYNVDFFLFAAPWIQRMIEDDDEEVIGFTKIFLTGGQDVKNVKFHFLSPEVAAVAKPMVAAMAEREKLTLEEIKEMFGFCETKARKRASKTPKPLLFDPPHFKWIMGLIQQLKFKRNEVLEFLQRRYNHTDRSPLHTPGALAVALPWLGSVDPKITLLEKLQILFEGGADVRYSQSKVALDNYEFHPTDVTVFEQNLADAKAWLEEGVLTKQDIQNVKRCVEAWIKPSATKPVIAERQELVNDWELLNRV